MEELPVDLKNAFLEDYTSLINFVKSEEWKTYNKIVTHFIRLINKTNSQVYDIKHWDVQYLVIDLKKYPSYMQFDYTKVKSVYYKILNNLENINEIKIYVNKNNLRAKINYAIYFCNIPEVFNKEFISNIISETFIKFYSINKIIKCYLEMEIYLEQIKEYIKYIEEYITTIKSNMDDALNKIKNMDEYQILADEYNRRINEFIEGERYQERIRKVKFEDKLFELNESLGNKDNTRINEFIEGERYQEQIRKKKFEEELSEFNESLIIKLIGTEEFILSDGGKTFKEINDRITLEYPSMQFNKDIEKLVQHVQSTIYRLEYPYS